MADKSGLCRLTIDIPHEQYELIQQLAEDIHGSQSDVLRRGLALMKVAVEADKKGDSLGIIHEGSVKTRLTGIR